MLESGRMANDNPVDVKIAAADLIKDLIKNAPIHIDEIVFRLSLKTGFRPQVFYAIIDSLVKAGYAVKEGDMLKEIGE